MIAAAFFALFFAPLLVLQIRAAYLRRRGASSALRWMQMGAAAATIALGGACFVLYASTAAKLDAVGAGYLAAALLLVGVGTGFFGDASRGALGER